MPLRDHFNPPVTRRTSWDALHGAWPTLMVIDLNKRLPSHYVASPRIHLGAAFEIDVAASECEGAAPSAAPVGTPGRGNRDAATAWAPPQPTPAVTTDLPGEDEYEVRVVEADQGRLVAAVQIVSPANKDRPDHRRTFAAKCAALLRQGVSVTLVDLVTVRRSNLYGDLLELLGESDPSLAPAPPPLYAVACRRQEHRPQPAPAWRLEAWVHALALGRALPTLPLWLAPDLAVPLELESTYEETCRVLRIP